MVDLYQILINKLDEFIRKYYSNQLLKGVLLFVAIFLVSFLLVNGLEYYGHFGTIPRTVLFYLFISVSILILYHYIITPLLKIRKIGKIISHEQASEIIGKHFTEIQDKLLNTLQLKKLYESGEENPDLLKAGIDQKIAQLKPVPFTTAIDFSKNRKFLKYTLPPLFILLLFFLISPSFLIKPAERIIHHTKIFAEEMPFHVLILNKTLKAFQQEDFILKIKVTGEQLPDEVFIESEGNSYRLVKENKILFSHTFKTLQKSKKFRLVAGKFKTEEYTINVFPKPVILDFTTEIKYPSYLDRKSELLENTGDLIVPEGTSVKWRFYTKDVEMISLKFDNELKSGVKKNGNVFEYESIFSKNQKYVIKATNLFVLKPDSLSFTITVIPDLIPSITVNQASDTLLPSRLYFNGIIKDDYGFSKLSFNYSIILTDDTIKKEVRIENLPFNKNLNQQSYYYSVDLTQIEINPGEEIEYFFEVCDNDALHGGKCSRTGIFTYKPLTPEEIDKLASQKEKEIEKTLETALKESKQIQKQIEELNRKLNEKTTLTWQDKKQIEDLLQKEKNIEDALEKVQAENLQKNNFEEQYNKSDSSLIDKQNQLNELFNQIMDDEMKKMVEELKTLLDKIDKNQVTQMLEKMKMSNKDIEKQLDRSLEMFKQIEFDKALTETIEKLKQLSDQQKTLAEKTESKTQNNEQIKEEQKEISKQFEEVNKKMDELEEKNKNLEEPNQFPNTDEKQKEIDQDLEQSQQSIEKNESKEAGKSQKKASQGMSSMAQQLEDMKNERDAEEAAEDYEMLRQILENLVRISFDQEDLMERTKKINRSDPKYLNLIKEQNDIKDDMAMVEDSLNQLAKRQIMIKPFIMREVSAINRNMKESVKGMNDRNIQIAASKQQFIMTSVNNLALMLDESLKKMESEMNSQCNKPGKSTCNKPGGKSGKKSIKSLRQMQEQLNKQMEGLKGELESQKKQGQGQKGTGGNRQMSEKLARMAAEQEAIRNEMKKYQDQMNEQGIKPDGQMSDAMSKMEQTEKDLVNKRILQETLNRQQEILTRLLESEKAELQREQEEKRKSTEAKNQKYSNPSSIFQYNIQKTSAMELLKTEQPSYNYFYRNKINSYFLKFN
jgi:hypothetical protein